MAASVPHGYYDPGEQRYYVADETGRRAATAAEAAAIQANHGSFDFAPLVAGTPSYTGEGGVYGYYDPGYQRYFITGAGERREATAAEAALIRENNGSYTFAPVSADTPSYTGEPTPGTVPGTATPAPDPYTNWMSHDAGSRSWRYLTPDLQAYYEQNPDEAFRQYTTDQFGDRQTPMLDYARNNYQDYWARYIKASEGHDDMHFTDTLSNDLAGQIRQSFTLQSPGQKGYQLSWQPSGRFTG